MAEYRTDAEELLLHWQERATIALVSYNRAANRCRVWDTTLGGTLAVVTAGVGTAVFASLQGSVSVTAKVIVGTISVLAAVLAGVQTFAALADRIEAYEKAGRRFGCVRRDIEQARIAISAAGSTEISAILDALSASLDEAAENSPNAPPRIRTRTWRHVKGRYTWWERLGPRLRGLPAPQRLGASEHSDKFLGASG